MDTKTKLMNRPVEEGTIVLLENIVKFKEFSALMELWRWEGITASSVVYLLEDATHFKKDELIDSLFEQMKVPRDPKLTYTESGKYVFINYNFKVQD